MCHGFRHRSPVIVCMNRSIKFSNLIRYCMGTCLKFLVHEIDGSGGAGDEEHLHDGVVEADEAGEEVKVAADEHHQKEDLGLARDSGTAPSLPDLHEEEDNCQEVRQVSEQTEYIHLVWNIINKFCLRHY